MNKWRVRRLPGVLWLLPLLLMACQPQVEIVEVTSEATVVEVTREVVRTRVVALPVATMPAAPLEAVVVTAAAPRPGTAERPIGLLFAPVVDGTVTAVRGEALAESLAEATGLRYQVLAPTTPAETLDALCDNPADTVAFLPALWYVLAGERCGAQIGQAAIQDGLPWHAAMIVVGRNSGLHSLEDLAGKRWGVPDQADLATSLFPRAMLAEAGVETGEIVELGSDSAAVLALYNGEVDFITATFRPPLMPYEETEWRYGVDDPELWRLLGLRVQRSPLGYTVVGQGPEFGGYRIRDARAAVFDTAPDIFSTTEILALTQQIPNDPVTFGADFPLGLARQIMAALAIYVTSEACRQSLCSSDFYNWVGLQPVEETFYDPFRFLVENLPEVGDIHR
ncbi:MAG: PhnD/SsuA/transferrin family substrate-binding protein [Chloroflexi bacterium]|nr:PhnD/SsuA/transferrin family substrate-binding protein [Chloroflexota bacterium]MCI0577352.1 PhnD/SsuA/transferrin family substrate-binding protein [Chloroflexota bacterium]MCI0645599.1 PhnD/SsuA/transferrin family substrate-binding protein [Chloroflexota bacterium]MCI0729632.1 PhnD/SsuA/transferrin family substrate-binding protein [Chloroflexota bacterium]